MNLDVARAILTKGKALVPDRFPQPAREVAEVWAEALGTVSLPWQIWNDAVILWATERVGDRMCTPKDLREAAFIVRDRWEQVPEKAAILDKARQQRLDDNYRKYGLPPVPKDDPPNRTLTGEQPSNEQVLAETRRRAQNGNQTRNEET